MGKDEAAKMPVNPVTPFAEGMAMMREMHDSLVASGFTEQQATRIIGVFLAESARST